jgi:YesN/AraC family two-component response regulator
LTLQAAALWRCDDFGDLAKLRVPRLQLDISILLLLVSTSMSVGQIVLHPGYSDQSHFTHRFRANTGVTPAVYRRERRAADSAR